MKDVVHCPCCPDYFTSTSKKTKRDKLLKSEKNYFKNLQQTEIETDSVLAQTNERYRNFMILQSLTKL